MKRTTFIIFIIIGLFMVSTIDLQARHQRSSLPQVVQDRTAIAAPGHSASHSQRGGNNQNQYRGGNNQNQYRNGYNLNQYRGGYNRYQYRGGRQFAMEMRMNEERIWRLERMLNRLGYYGSQWEIQRLEQEIYSLQMCNDYLLSRLY
jgi:hypothetical protein